MLKKRISLLMTLMLCLGLVTTVLATTRAEYGIIQGGSLRLRSGPSTDAHIIASYPSGTWVELLGTNGDFYRVSTDDGRRGYMMARYIDHDTLGPGSWGTVENGSRYVNLRSGPSTDDPVIGVYHTGDRFQLLEYGDIFSRVRFDGNTVGYISSGLTRLDSETVWEEESVHTTHGGKLNIREGPSSSAPVLGSYPQGTEVIVLIQGNTWNKVFVEGVFGYMDNAYLRPRNNGDAGTSALYSTPNTAVEGDQITDNADFVPDESTFDSTGVDPSQGDG